MRKLVDIEKELKAALASKQEVGFVQEKFPLADPDMPTISLKEFFEHGAKIYKLITSLGLECCGYESYIGGATETAYVAWHWKK